ncbi:MAG: glycosyltransferase family 4 protein [Rubrivivax sp.]|nr:glycosyltransferase family 4 protein [Rubrivivax sp.]MDP3612752.1 glycosyltransferase family 4 protein [Rubrivivax sp.]
MNILYLNHYAGSPALGMEYRPYYLAREWVRAGHRVQMLAADFSHVRTQQPQAGDQVIDGIVYRCYATPPYQGNGLGRVKNIWAFLRAVWADTPRLVREFSPQVVIASSTYPMDIWVARRIARLARAKLVFEVHDLWPLSPIELSGMSRWHPFALLCQAAEDAAYRNADVVVSMLPKVQGHMAGRGLDLKKLHIVPNGITLDEWQGQPPPLREDVLQALAAARAAGHTVVGYAGSMGLPNALDTLLDAAALLKHEPLHIVLVGGGHEQARLAQRAAAEGLSKVCFLPPIPKAQVPAFLAGVDIAYIGWQRVPIYRFGIAPNKLMDYMMARCAVLHAVEAGNDPVAEAAAGLTVAPDSPADVAQGLLKLAALPAEERRAMGERGRNFVLAHHTYPVLAQRFLEALK